MPCPLLFTDKDDINNLDTSSSISNHSSSELTEEEEEEKQDEQNNTWSEFTLIESDVCICHYL
jgi:hypothetical protein